MAKLYFGSRGSWTYADLLPQSLQASVQRVHTYVQSLEEKIDDLNKKKK